MSTYKSLALPNKRPVLERPMRRLFDLYWSQKEKIRPVLFIVSGAVMLVAGLLWYQGDRSRQAFALLGKEPWSHAEEVVSRYPRSDAALIARLALGKKALEQQNWDQAIASFQALLSRTPDQPLYHVAGLMNLALAYRGKGNLDQSLVYLQRAAGDSKNPIADYAQLLVGQVLYEKGDRAGAIQIYATLAQSASLPEVRKEAEAFKKWIAESK